MLLKKRAVTDRLTLEAALQVFESGGTAATDQPHQETLASLRRKIGPYHNLLVGEGSEPATASPVAQKE